MKGAPIDGVRLVETLEIGEQCAERYQFLEPPARGCYPATRSKHVVERNAASLIDCQQLTLDVFARRTHHLGPRQMRSCIREAVCGRRHLRRNQLRAKRVVRAGEMRSKHLQAVQRIQIAEELEFQPLHIDKQLGSAGAHGSCMKRVQARRRALSRFSAAISPSVANGTERSYAAAEAISTSEAGLSGRKKKSDAGGGNGGAADLSDPAA